MNRLFKLIGPNGAGKTGILRILSSSAERIADGLTKALFSQISEASTSFLLQSSQRPIFSRYVHSLLMTPLIYSGATFEASNDRVRSLLARFSFSYLWGRDYFTLSGGERQFVSLFSTLMWERRLYLLDDPTVMLDKKRAKHFTAVLGEFVDEGSGRHFIVSAADRGRYESLKAERTINVGYSPDPATCVRELELLLSKFGNTDREPTIVGLESLTVAPFDRELLIKQSMDIDSRRLVLLGGDNGQGKTCILQTIAGLRTPKEGKVFLSTQNQVEPPIPGHTSLYLPQDSAGVIGFGTVAEELKGLASPNWWKQVVDFFCDWRVLRPTDRASEGSFGEVRFLAVLSAIGAIARSNNIKMLLLDEPDASLDELRRSLLGTLLRWLAHRGMWVCVVTHHPAIYEITGAQHTTKQLILSDRSLH